MVPPRRRRLVAIAAAVATVLGLAACSDEGAEPPETTASATGQPTGSGQAETSLTFGVYGSAGEVAAYEQMARTFEGADVRVTAKGDADEATLAYRSGAELPDVFLLPRRNLRWFVDRNRTQPVDELLDERGVNFGDDYSRDALLAFAADDALQCMPFALSPMVVYYNTDLIDFDRMEARGLDVPEDSTRWTFAQFQDAARFASRPRRGTKGVWIEPTVRGLAPFIFSGGGELFDDDQEPTSLAFSSEDTRAALATTLELLRNPQLTPSQDQLERTSALELFEDGRLGMIAGFRDLTPQLRQQSGLNFDVMPMPTLDSQATIGDFVGLCLSARSENTGLAADFLVHALSPESVQSVAKAGYVVPANAEVAASDSFLQPGREPEDSRVFTDSIRYIRLTPALESYSRLQDVVGRDIAGLVNVPVLDLPTQTEDIDEASRRLLDPESPSESPSD